MYAVDRGHVQVVKLLLESSIGNALVVARDNTGSTALDWARVLGNRELEALLLEHGAVPGTGVISLAHPPHSPRSCRQHASTTLDSSIPASSYWRDKPVHHTTDTTASTTHSQPIRSPSELVARASPTATPLDDALCWDYFGSTTHEVPERRTLTNDQLRDIYDLISADDEDDASSSSSSGGAESESILARVLSPIRVPTNKTFLRHVLMAGGSDAEAPVDHWWLGIRERGSTLPLIGFIAATRTQLSIHGVETPSIEIHELVLDPRWRGKRLAPILINEMERIILRSSAIGTAVFTTSNVLAIKPLCSCATYTKALNLTNVLRSPFLRLLEYQTLAEMQYQLDQARAGASRCGDLVLSHRPLHESDLATAQAFLATALQHKPIHERFSLAGVRYRLLEHVADAEEQRTLHSYMVFAAAAAPATESATERLVGIAAFTLSHVHNTTTQRPIRLAHLTYVVGDSHTCSSEQVLAYALHSILLASDVCDAVTLLENGFDAAMLREPAVGLVPFSLAEPVHVHLFNWRCSPVSPANVAIKFW